MLAWLIELFIRRPAEVTEMKLWREFIREFSGTSWWTLILSTIAVYIIFYFFPWEHYWYKVDDYKKVLKVGETFIWFFVIVSIIQVIAIFIVGVISFKNTIGIETNISLYINLFVFCFVLLGLLFVFHLILSFLLCCIPIRPIRSSKFRRAHPLFKRL